MTVSSEVRQEGTYVGTGLVSLFPFEFKVFKPEDLLVVTSTAGVESILVLDSDYSVTLNPDQDAAPGGNVTLVAPLAVGVRMDITSDIAPLQLIDFTNQGGFYPEVVTAAFDKVTILVQQLKSVLGRALKFPITDAPPNPTLPGASQLANKFLAFDADGNPIASEGTGATGLREDLAASNGSSLIGFLQAGTGAVLRTVQSKLREEISVKDFGAIGDGTVHLLSEQFATLVEAQSVYPFVTSLSQSIDAVAIQAAINAVAAIGGGSLRFPSGTYLVDQVVWKTGVYGYGDGHSETVIMQIAGSNKDFVISDGYGTSDIYRFGIRDMSFNGNYFISLWNANPGVLGNTSGFGLKMQAHNFKIDIGLSNIAGVGAYFKQPVNSSGGNYDTTSELSLDGRDFGQEGVVLEGDNDWIVNKLIIGRCGILPLPAAATTAPTSTLYPASPVHGIVLDGINVEIKLIHVYACWGGTGFVTLNAVRLSKGGRIISESNNAQVDISANTYGAATFQLRNLALIHPNWSGTVPTYAYPNRKYDGITIDADRFDCDIDVFRTITGINRVIGVTAVVINSGAKVRARHANSGAPSGDPEFGHDYSGDFCVIAGQGANVDLTSTRCYGNAVKLLGIANFITFAVGKQVTGSAFYRDAGTNSQRGNIVSGTIVDCTTGFTSTGTGGVGTPMSEVLNISMELKTGQVPFTGVAPDLSRGQIWNICASVANVKFGTKSNITTGALDLTGSPAIKTIAVAHNFLYTPSFKQVTASIQDQATLSKTPPTYSINAIDATNVTIAYYYPTTPDAAANHIINISVQ